MSSSPECTFFEVYQSAEGPGTLSWVENWSKSKEWFAEHRSYNQMTKAYYHEYMAVTTPMYVRPRKFKRMTRVAPYGMVKRSNGGPLWIERVRGCCVLPTW
ncbi:putative quinol monooxygenase [Aspergillus ibericus CBS 121593]|uniref:ABM domain-containing protein n=1 Tax=Aspergillus ibericus CBS 121593 TaxID=1448316 RepID=A0A395GSJ1_9EURO|nr:hypothetical protein BO80DRAFT_361378 [Aspergillus ibericus CBS 121593]RAK98550.1 hypothetical protein BO80DRAFT_361378 [Aspergillus ibericus CBS 121593]